MENTTPCTRCGHPAPSGARFCGACGMALKGGLRESGMGTLALTMGVLAMLYTFWSLFAVAVLWRGRRMPGAEMIVESYWISMPCLFALVGIPLSVYGRVRRLRYATAALALCVIAVAFTAINIGWFWEHL